MWSIQLFSVCAMVKQDVCIKHVPTAFVLMTRRKTEDYRNTMTHDQNWKCVPQHILQQLNNTPSLTGKYCHEKCFLPCRTYCCQNQWATKITDPTGRNVSPDLIIRSFSKLSSRDIFMWWVIWPFINFCWTYFGYTQKLRVVPSEIDWVWITAWRYIKKTNILISWCYWQVGRRADYSKMPFFKYWEWYNSEILIIILWNGSLQTLQANI